MSLLGTELNFAYSPLGATSSSPYGENQMFFDESQEEMPMPKQEMQQKKPAVKQAAMPPPQQPALYDSSTINKQYEQEQKLMNILTEIKKQKNMPVESQPTYVDKLFSKKKEIWKFLQLALIVVLGLAIHNIVKYYMKYYISNNDLSTEREFFLRLLYPLAIIFVLWNLKVFVK